MLLRDKSQGKGGLGDDDSGFAGNSHAVAGLLFHVVQEVGFDRQAFGEHQEPVLLQLGHNSIYLIIVEMLQYLSQEHHITIRQIV
jgi:hypothetical protein